MAALFDFATQSALSFLSPPEVARAAAVSARWRRAAAAPLLWRAFFLRDFAWDGAAAALAAVAAEKAEQAHWCRLYARAAGALPRPVAPSAAAQGIIKVRVLPCELTRAHLCARRRTTGAAA